MGWSLTVLSAPPLVAALISAGLVWDAWEYRSDSVGRPFLALVGVIAGWSLTYAIQLGFTTAGEQVAWYLVSVSLSTLIPVFWLVLTLRYAGRYEWLTEYPRVLVFLVHPVVVVGLAATNPLHGLVISGGTLASAGGILVIEPGPVYVPHLVYSYAVVVAGIALLLRVFVHAAIYRLQAGLLVVGAIFPLAANVAFNFGLNPVPNLDLTTFTFTLTGVVFGLALFRFDLLNLQPIARERLISELGDGLVVVDDSGEIVDLNGIVRDAFPGVEKGACATEALPVEDIEDADGTVVEATRNGRTRFYEYRDTPLSDHRDRQVGRVVAFQDVTARHEYEQRLEVTNRLLRHNLRNDTTKILGWAEVIAEAGTEETTRPAERIQATAKKLAGLSEKAGRIRDSMEARDRDPVTIDLEETLTEVVTGVRAEWPGAEISVVVEDGTEVRTPSADLLEAALRNVVENAVEHNDAEDPEVEITVEGVTDDAGDPRVRIHVADNGPGIPVMERETLVRGTETTLEHGSGLGLWLVNWITQASGGDLHFEENDPRGSVVVLDLRPVGKESPDLAYASPTR